MNEIERRLRGFHDDLLVTPAAAHGGAGTVVAIVVAVGDGVGTCADNLWLARFGSMLGKTTLSGNFFGRLTPESFTPLGIIRLRGLILAIVDPIVHPGRG